MISGSVKYPHWTEDGSARVMLSMDIERARSLEMALLVLRPYTGQALEDLELAISDALRHWRADETSSVRD